MARPTLTGWFDSRLKPSRVGVYEVMNPYQDNSGWAYWDGKAWGGQYTTREQAEANTASFGAEQDKQWRAHAQPYKGYDGE